MTTAMTARLLLLLVLLTGCAGRVGPIERVQEGNYLTFQHAFTDAGADAARREAEKHCVQTKRVAVRTGGVCSLSRCTTHYQCMDQEDAARALAPEKK
jgi:hypothetical protein